MKNLIIFIFWLMTPMIGSAEKMNNPLYELPDNCDFLQAVSNSGLSFDCSPQLIPKFSNPFNGILINSPDNVLWDKDLDPDDFMVSPFGEREGPFRVMISGLLKVPSGTLDVTDDYIYKIVIIAVNQQTSKVYSGRMNRIGQKSPELDPSLGFDINSDKLESSMAGDCKEHFNVDLVQNLNIPIASATYSVYVVLGEYKSNVREVKVILE